jgi:hypothetical protein
VREHNYSQEEVAADNSSANDTIDSMQMIAHVKKLCKFIICLLPEGTSVVPAQTTWTDADAACMRAIMRKTYSQEELDVFRQINQGTYDNKETVEKPDEEYPLDSL